MSQGRGLSLSQNARLFAELNIALADAAIVSWNLKYTSNFWRPVTAIGAAASDGNDATLPDPSWTPLITTPNSPSFVSEHATFGGAATLVLATFFGQDNVAFTLPSEDATVAARHFTSFTQAAIEAANSQIFAGDDFRFDTAQGTVLGAKIGTFISDNYLVSDPNRDFHYVGNLYHQLLNRTGRMEEIRSWVVLIRLGLTRAGVVQGFLTSVEYRRNLVDSFYVKVLGRHADEVGLRGWVGALGVGFTESQVLAAIASSPEFFARAGGTVDGYIRGLYATLLNRTNVRQAEVDGWVGFLAGQGNRFDVAALFVTSREFHTLLVDGINISFGGWYDRYLHRAGDFRGVTFWLNSLDQNDSWQVVQRGLLTSAENAAQ